MHIADVAAFVKSGSTADRDAAYMGSGTVALVDDFSPLRGLLCKI